MAQLGQQKLRVGLEHRQSTSSRTGTEDQKYVSARVLRLKTSVNPLRCRSVPSVSCLLTQSQLNSFQRDQCEDGKQSGQGAFWGHLSRIVWQAEEAILRSERVTVRRAEIQI